MGDDALVSYSIVADCIAKKAYHLGKNKSYDSPFAQSAKKYGKRYKGGKHDDITVTVAQVVQTTATTTVRSRNVDDDDDDDDPHYKESIKLYTTEDGPIGLASELPNQQTILQTMMDEAKVTITATTTTTDDAGDAETKIRKTA